MCLGGSWGKEGHVNGGKVCEVIRGLAGFGSRMKRDGKGGDVMRQRAMMAGGGGFIREGMGEGTKVRGHRVT